MPRISNEQYEARIKQAAVIFANVSRDVKVIAAGIGADPRSVYRIFNDPRFQEHLDEMGYTGKRSLRTRPKRPLPPEYYKAKRLWDAFPAEMPPRERGKVIHETLEIPMSTLKNWIQKWKNGEG